MVKRLDSFSTASLGVKTNEGGNSMRLNYFYILAILGFAIASQGCSSHTMAIKYQPTNQDSSQDVQHKIGLVNVLDSRGTESNWLGAIRGGYGNPLKKLYTEGDTAGVVSYAFEEALRSRGLLAPAALSEYRLDVNLQKFDTSYYFNKEAHSHFIMSVVHSPTNKTIFSNSYRVDKEKVGAGAGIFGNVDALASFANETLNDSIDKALDDPGFLAALKLPGNSFNTNSSIQSRLEKLENLLENSLISKDEYELKRKEILGGL